MSERPSFKKTTLIERANLGINIATQLATTTLTGIALSRPGYAELDPFAQFFNHEFGHPLGLVIATGLSIGLATTIYRGSKKIIQRRETDVMFRNIVADSTMAIANGILLLDLIHDIDALYL